MCRPNSILILSLPNYFSFERQLNEAIERHPTLLSEHGHRFKRSPQRPSWSRPRGRNNDSSESNEFRGGVLSNNPRRQSSSKVNGGTDCESVCCEKVSHTPETHYMQSRSQSGSRYWRAVANTDRYKQRIQFLEIRCERFVTFSHVVF